MSTSVLERFWDKVEVRGKQDCWPWTGCRVKGYGQFAVSRAERVYAHRFSYEAIVGKIPGGLTIDHLCRNRSCVNPAHLEPVTNRVNTLRGNGPTAANSRKTHCPNGHPYDEKHTRVTDGKRYCRACRNARQRELRAVRHD